MTYIVLIHRKTRQNQIHRFIETVLIRIPSTAILPFESGIRNLWGATTSWLNGKEFGKSYLSFEIFLTV